MAKKVNKEEPKNKVGRPRLLSSPQELWDLFERYKMQNEEISIKGFENYSKGVIGNIDRYFNKPYPESFTEVILKVKEAIYENKVALYKRGKLPHSKIVRESKARGLTLDKSISTFKEIIKEVVNNQFEIENGLLTVSDSFLKKKNAQSTNLVSKKIPDTIYVLNINGSNLYKIGVSQNIKRRINDIRASMPFSIDLIIAKKSLFAFDLEQKIHQHYKDYHVKNEWFKITNTKELLAMINK
jgi:SMC interacting uncharacterized protein involved in chromosome segregation